MAFGGLEHLEGEGKLHVKTGVVVVIMSGEEEEGNCLLPLDLIIIWTGEVGLVCWGDWRDIELMLRKGRLREELSDTSSSESLGV